MLPRIGRLQLDAGAINAAVLEKRAKPTPQLVIRAEVLLARAGFSLRVLSMGERGISYRKAVAAFQQQNDLPPDRRPERRKLCDIGGYPRRTQSSSNMRFTDKDVAGPFQKHIPSALDAIWPSWRGFRTPGLGKHSAEKFHMSETLIGELNPSTDFRKAGVRIRVANVARRGKQGRLLKLSSTSGYDHFPRSIKNGALIAFYPASVGSKEKTSPDSADTKSTTWSAIQPIITIRNLPSKIAQDETTASPFNRVPTIPAVWCGSVDQRPFLRHTWYYRCLKTWARPTNRTAASDLPIGTPLKLADMVSRSTVSISRGDLISSTDVAPHASIAP